ncbi:MAG: hypothetical protein AB1634_11375, partial [Thermodesulfobacteriota bacterium]
DLARFGKWAQAELQRLCHMAHDPPTKGEWSAFYARLLRLIALPVTAREVAVHTLTFACSGCRRQP